MEKNAMIVDEAKKFIIDNVGKHLEWKLIKVSKGYVYYSVSVSSIHNSTCSLEIPVMGNTFYSMMDNEDLDSVLTQGSTLFFRDMEKYVNGIKFIIIENQY